MMVHVGLANEGSEIVVPRAEQAWTKARDMQISVSIARTNDDKTGDLDEGIEDYCISMRRTAGRTAMVEVNISCPNTMAGEPFNQSLKRSTSCSPNSTRSNVHSHAGEDAVE